MKDKRAVLLAANLYMGRILSTLLRKFGLDEVLVVERLAQLNQKGVSFKPDLIVIDHILPDGDGIDFVRSLRRDETGFDRKLPVMLCSAGIDRTTAIAARDNGFNDILVQPVQPDALARKLGTLFLENRDFVIAPSYVGPDRRRQEDPAYSGKDRRGDEVEDELDQDEVDSIMSDRVA